MPEDFKLAMKSALRHFDLCKMIFELEFFTEDKKLQELCKAYWLTDADEKFIYQISELEQRFCVSDNAIKKRVEKNCRAFSKKLLCKKNGCSKPTIYFTNRNTAQRFRRYQYQYGTDYDYCEDCKNEMDRRAELQAELEKEDGMREAFETKSHEKLNDLQFKFLKSLAIADNLTAARRRIGLSEWNAMTILNELNDLNLINYNVKTRSYPILLNNLKLILRPKKSKPEMKSVFGSPKALELFRNLKEKHPFVFPEIPLCAFVDQSQIKHLFVEKLGDWQTASPRFRYFLTARIDFLVCDSEGRPQIAYEYQGGYHKDKEQIEKDEFKKLVLSEIDLPLKEIKNGDF